MTRRPSPTASTRRATKRLLACTAAALALAAVAAAAAPAAIPAAPGGPILVVTSNGDGFGSYLPEILRGEGLNEFDVADVGSVAPQTLAAHDVVVLGHMSLSDAQVAMLSAWVQGGGNLVAMRPDKKLAGLLGLADAGGTRDEGNLTSVAGAASRGASMRFHGSADLYGLAGASPVATLDTRGSPPASRCATSAPPAARPRPSPTTSRARSSTRGRATPRGRARSATATPRRSAPTTCSSAATQPDWVDLNRVQVPAADEQQRMLANLIIGMENDRMPLPRFWYLPRGAEGGRRPHGRRPRLQPGRHQRAVQPLPRRQPARLLGRPVAVRALDLATSSRAPPSRTPRRRPSRPRASRSRCTSGSRATPPGRRRRRQLPQLPSPPPWATTSRAARAVPADLPEHRRAGDATATTASSTATGPACRTPSSARASAWTRTTTTGPARGSRTAPASSPARASRCASPRPTAR